MSHKPDRRAFLRLAATAAGSLFLGSRLAAQERSRVVLARAKDLQSVFGTPSYNRILDLMTRAVTVLAGEPVALLARKHYFSVNDQLAVQLATTPLSVIPEVVDATVTTAARGGVAPDHIFIYSAEERDLYRAGFALQHQGPGVRCYGATSEGYHDSLTTLLGTDVTALVNLPCLSPHRQAGLAGALENFANSVKPSYAQECYADNAAALPGIAAERAIQTRLRLHIMDCLRPAYDLPGDHQPPSRWEYNGLLLSTDPVALDAVATHLLLAKRREVKGAEWPLDPYPLHVEIAASKYKLGTADLASIDLLRLGPMEDALI
jgi:hypothetical protein